MQTTWALRVYYIVILRVICIIAQSSAAMKLTTAIQMLSAFGMVTNTSASVWMDSQAMDIHALIAVIVCHI